MSMADDTAGMVPQIAQQLTLDGSGQGRWWLATTAMGKEKRKDSVNREEEGLL